MYIKYNKTARFMHNLSYILAPINYYYFLRLNKIYKNKKQNTP